MLERKKASKCFVAGCSNERIPFWEGLKIKFAPGKTIIRFILETTAKYLLRLAKIELIR